MSLGERKRKERNLPLERSAFIFQEFSAHRQTFSVEGRLVHVCISSVLMEAKGKSPKGMYVALCVLFLHLACAVLQLRVAHYS